MTVESASSHPESSGSHSTAPGSDVSGWVEGAARAGYTAKGAVYAVIGFVALQQAIGNAGDIAGSREALREIFSGPLGTAGLALVSLGLVGYVVWRLVQATTLPGRDQEDDGDGKRWALRLFYLVSAVIYAILAWYAVSLLMGEASGGGSGGAGASGGSNGGSSGFAATIIQLPLGVWLLGAVGAGIVSRGLLQLRKAYTDSFREKIETFELDQTVRTWVIRASRVGLTARGIVFGIIGVTIIIAAVQSDPSEARGTEGALQMLTDRAWLLGLVGAGLICYALYQWTKARYRLIGA